MGVGRSRAQAAIEFLITNGWAILAVIILLAALLYIGVLSPQQNQPNTCLFSPGLTCYSFKVGNGSGTLELDFGQALGKSIQVTGISCSPNESATLSPITPVHIPSGEHRWIAGGDSNNTNITCEGATGEPGDRYSGRVCVSYEELDTRTSRITCCDMRARLEPGVVPSPTPTPLPTPPPGAIPVTCGTTISSFGYYYLEGNLTSDSTCITIDNGGSGSTLNCYGNTITGTFQNGIGIYLNSVSGVTVQNCNVSNFWFGIALWSSNNNNLVGNAANSNYVGIYLSSCSGNNLTGNTASLNYYGIALDSSGDNILTSNTASSNAEGIYLYYSSNNILTGNTVMVNQYGIHLDSSTDNNFTGNTACWNQYDSIYCDVGQNDGGGNICRPYGGTVCSDSVTCNSGCSPPEPPACAPNWVVSSCPCTLYVPGNYTLDSNLSTSGGCIDFAAGSGGSTLDCRGHSITSSGGSSIYLSGVSGVTVENCIVSNSVGGISLSSSSSNNLIGNTASSNRDSGISLHSSSNNNLTGNTANSNRYGIYLYSSSDNNLTDNTANSNRYGIVLSYSSNIILTGNTACTNAVDISCDYGQNEGGGNICRPYGGTVCSDSITCNSGCPPLSSVLITDCSSPYRIYSAANYYLDSDLNAGRGDCIDFYGGSGSTLDCQGHNITGQGGGNGIYLNGARGVTVRNCVVSNFSEGIYLVSSSDNSLTGNTASSNDDGIYLQSSSNNNNIAGNTASSNVRNGIYLESSSNNNNIAGNTASSSSYGISLEYSSDNNLTGNTASSNYKGISLQFSSNNLIGNTASSNRDSGIYLNYANGNNITGNTASSNSYYGISLESSSNNNLSGNTASSNNYGIFLWSSRSNNLMDNTASSNSYGIYLQSSSNNNLTGNTANSNGQGINVGSSSRNNLTTNTASSNDYEGIVLNNANYNILTGNTATSNSYGIYLESSSDNNLTGNNASSNAEGIYLWFSSDNNILTNNIACANTGSYDIYCESAQPGDGGNTCRSGKLSCSGVTCPNSCP